MTIKKSYLVVANHDHAIAYAYANNGTELNQEKEFKNEFSEAKDQDIYTDRPGRQSAPSSHVQGVDSMDRKDAAELEDERFAGDIADWLDKIRKTNGIASLDLISGPSFLGKLRNALPNNFDSILDKQVTKNVLGADEQTLLSYVK